MGLFGSKNVSNSKGSTTGQDTMSGSTAFNTTTAPTNPDWVMNGAQSIFGGAQALAGANPATYVAGPNSTLTHGATTADSLTGTPWNYDAASDLTRSVGQADTPDIASWIGSFMSPYLKQVVNATSADLDHSDGIARANDDLALAGSGAFGGSGAALTKAATEGELSRARATSLGGLRNQGYNTALGGAEAQAQLQQQQQQQRLDAASRLAGISDEYGANVRANSAAQTAAGAPIQAIDQQKAQAPLDLNSWLATMFGGALPQLFQGQTQAGTEDQNSTESQTGTSKTNGTSTTIGVK
jgi:hypothetical protein